MVGGQLTIGISVVIGKAKATQVVGHGTQCWQSCVQAGGAVVLSVLGSGARKRR